MKRTLTIRNLDAFKAKLEALNRRARRLGIEETTFRVTGTRQEEVQIFELDENPMSMTGKRLIGTETVLVTDIEIAEVTPVVALSGWFFRARLTPHGVGNIISGIPGIERDPLPERFRTCDIECEHCRTNRRRNDSFVLEHETGVFKQVGRNCLVDFIGNNNAERVARQFEFQAEVAATLGGYEDCEREGWTGGGERTYSIEELVGRALYIDKGAYTSVAKAREVFGVASTAEKVRCSLKNRVFETGYREHAATMEEKAATMIAAVLPRLTGENDYESNLRVILGAGYCVYKTIGIGVSVIAAFNRMEREAAERAATADSTHIGALGERISVRGTVLLTWVVSGDFGTTTKFLVRTAEGNLVVANNLPAEKGEEVSFMGKVKAHSEWKGAKRTELSRPTKVINHTKEAATEQAA